MLISVSKILLILLLLCLKFEIHIASFEDEYPGINICQNDNIQQENMHELETKLKILDNIAKNKCTHIQGSLYIRGLKNLPINKKELNFDYIQEIDGHLIIESNELEKISFKKLRIIRGLTSRKRQLADLSFVNVSLDVAGNFNLVELDLSSLKSINDFNVLFTNNPKLRYIPHMISWIELFTNSKTQRIIMPNLTSEILYQDKCSQTCTKWSSTTQIYCWGPLDTQCQKKVLCSSTHSVYCETCNHLDGTDQYCCSDQCLGGCSAPGHSNCTACKRMLNGAKCTDGCPSPYSGGIAGTAQNKEFKYHTGSFCSKTCPKIMLPEESTCVHKCSDGYFKNETNFCIKCYGDKCKKEDLQCKLIEIFDSEIDMTLNKEMLKKLKNCTKILGYLVISNNTFTKFNITVQMLYDYLGRVNDLEGGFSYFKDHHLKNLTFLDNLKSFRAANLHVQVSGVPNYNKFMISTTNLDFLGLRSLKKIEGNFFLNDNKKLCYMNATMNGIVFGKYKNMDNNSCVGKICHDQCSFKGCWGPGNKMCFECKNFDANGTCVSDCHLAKGFYFPKNSSVKNGTCFKCHNECERTCIGPGNDQCIKGCANKKEKGVCVPKCSNNYYESPNDRKVCLPCHSDCLTYGGPTCTGSSDVPGPGGCNKCEMILLSNRSEIVKCVKKCPNAHYTEISSNEMFSKFSISHVLSCLPCFPFCSKCTGKSSFKTSCEICDGYWYKDICKEKCPSSDSYDFYGNNSQKYCRTCDKNCATGCTGPKSSHCINCKFKKIYHFNKTTFFCASKCPPNKMTEEIEDKTSNTVCLSIWDSKNKIEERNRIKVTVGVVVTMILLVIIVIVIIVVCLRRKAAADQLETELKARYSNLMEPNSKDEDMLNKPPNMGRLVIVSKEDLIFDDESRPLGFGAFGYVYKGKWKIPKEQDTLLRKSSGIFYLPVAIKVIKNMGNEEVESIMQEAKMMASVSHMHCLRFIGVSLSYEKPCLISAYVKDGSLDKYLVRNKSKITSFIMLSWCEQMADGMLYLTKRNIIHRDLAARNVLVNRLECIQITDFGLAKMLESTKEKEIIIKTGKVPIRWLAIETLTDGKYSHETDVWAYGVTLWEIFTFGKVPYEDQATHDIFDFVLKGGRLSQPDICSLDVYILMVNCWLESPNLRPDFQSLMKTFMDYSKMPGRYLSIQGDPYEIPSPNNIEMTNLNNPYYEDHFNFTHGTAETMLPLFDNRELMDHNIKDFTYNRNGLPDGDDGNEENDVDELLLSTSDKEQLPTRSNNRTSNIFKRFQENRQPQNSLNTRNTNPTRLVSLASQEEPIFRNQSQAETEEDPRYVADPTDKLIKMRQQPTKSHFLQETPRFHSNIRRDNNSPYNQTPNFQSLNASQEIDGYLEPTRSNITSENTDSEGYLEPVTNAKTGSLFSQDEYMVPSHPNTPIESTINNKRGKNSEVFKISKDYLTMDEESSPKNLYFPNKLVDDEYLEPEPKSRLINSTHR